MDCNKDEAVRAKEIAERKLKERDYASAKKFSLKAHSLYPELEGLSQLLTTIDVYMSAEKKLGGEVDWYGVLGVKLFADDDTVKKHYRKLALMLHPDKNKSIGADGAFKLVSEAWSFLSDRAKRLVYNQKLNSRGFQQNVPTQSGLSSAPPTTNGFHNCSTNVTSNARMHTQMGPTSVRSPKPDTFWTICNKCKTQYEYLKIYLNQTLLCPNCHEAFLALEKAPPPNALKSTNYSSSQQHKNSRQHAANSNSFDYGRKCAVAQDFRHGSSMGHNSSNNAGFQWGAFGTMAASTSTAAKATNVVQQAHEKGKREHEETRAVTKRDWDQISQRMSLSGLKAERLVKKTKTDFDRTNSYGVDTSNQKAMGNGFGLRSGFDSRFGKFEASLYGSSCFKLKPKSERELSPLEIRNMLMKKARIEICKQLQEWSSATKSKKAKEKENKNHKSVVNGDTHDLNKHGGFSVSNKDGHNKNLSPESSDDDLDGVDSAPMSINVPDSDFHNFDLDRNESSFRDDQIWAAYDEDDGMPRYYARILKVISMKPFKMRISWLNSKSNSEFGPLNWVGSGFAKTCGDFRSGKHEISETLNYFSHQVKWTRGARGVIHVYPRKGDVWALYRNWSPDWNEHTPDEVIHKYDMVEVLDDYNEKQGVSVAPLVKVAGFRTLFHKHTDPKEVRRIPKEEMFCFSHQVPNSLLTGQEGHNAPIGCRELDPAATPSELLQVITEGNEALNTDNGEKVGGEMLMSAPKIEGDEMVENASKDKEVEMVGNGENTITRDSSA
ncbi:DnaJ domain-containing protein/DUF3444 domain-containing protein [Cephalotus follicularis]|uniref:DnaJ domain-containing protein/DUF3444 domain-containing protein n=1 Tax=Cephalotus follicularis TaxID=3775 RepID=A0A1Q3BE42_CEPFO|nr:DnaJ domain-containing protein/DUF3444 domain-containing protein [Cephalotus follicularis]